MIDMIHTGKERPVKAIPHPFALTIAVLTALLAAVTVISLMTGRIFITPGDVIKILVSRFLPIPHSFSATFESVIIDVRLPRVLAGVLVGAGLSLSGAAFQGLFRNPLVSPHLLGVAAGSGFGAAIAILLFSNILITQVSAFIFGVVAVALAYMLSRTYRSAPILMLVLSGLIVG